MGKKKKKKCNKTALAVNNTANVSVVNNYYTTPNYDKKGRKNETNFPDFIKLCKLGQYSLRNMLIEKLTDAGYKVKYGDGYVYAKGNIPILLTAHMDTVHKFNVKEFYEYYDKEKKRHIISSPQGIGGDDRCGIYMILEIIKTHKCSVLFCEDEERGGIGSDKFCKCKSIDELSNMKYLIELDRMNASDAVFYNCDNPNFTKFIEENTGYKTAYGTFSDISNLAPECGVAAVNLSCGYYNAHKASEYVVVEEMLNTIEVVKKLLDVECEQFDYIEEEVDYGYGRYGRYDYGFDNEWVSEYYKKYYGKDKERTLLILLAGSENETVFYVSNGTSVNEAFGKFFIDNPAYCYNDIVDYKFYESKVYEEGWYSSKTIQK